MVIAVQRFRLFKNGDKHRRNILQNVFGPSPVKKLGMLLELVRDLINDEATARGECVMSLTEQFELLVDLKNAERNSGHNKIARRNSTAMQFVRQPRRVVVDYVNPRVID